MNSIKKNIIFHENDKAYDYNIIRSNKKFNKSFVSSPKINIKRFSIKDKDKTNLESTKYFSEYRNILFNNNSKENQNVNFLNIKKFKTNLKEAIHPLLKSFNKNSLLFGNELIRDKNKKLTINIIEHEVSMKNLLKAKQNKNNCHIIKDITKKNNNNDFNDKNKIINILKTQTKSNFNNKYKLMFKSSNTKKRKLIQSYFSFIKNDFKEAFENMSPSKRILSSYKTIYKKNLNKKIFDSINNNYINKSKRNILFSPIMTYSNYVNKENIKLNFTKNKSFDKNKNKKIHNNEIFSFYTVKNHILKTENNFLKI